MYIQCTFGLFCPFCVLFASRSATLDHHDSASSQELMLTHYFVLFLSI